MSAKTMFKKAAIASAVVGALSATSAQAVNLSEDGLGEAVFVPYYTAANGFNTYLHITNTSGETTIAKIRFREGYNSREVRDFNIVLSPYDVWTAVVTEGDNGGAKMVTYDTTCTVPAVIGATSPSEPGSILFTIAEFDGPSADKQDGAPDGFARTLEGYVEIFSLGRDGNITDTTNGFTDLSANALHEDKPEGYRAPVDCSAVELQFSSDAHPTAGVSYIQNTSNMIDEPMNTLSVTAQVLNVMDGTGYGVDAVHLANFFNPLQVDGLSATDLVYAPGSVRPNIDDAQPTFSEVRVGNVSSNVMSEWATGYEAVEAVLMRDNVINRFRQATGQADTDVVVTFPTKWAHVDPDFDLDGPATAPFAEHYNDEETNDGPGSYIRVGINTYDREEDSFTAVSICSDPYTGETFPAGAGGLCPSPTVLVSETYGYLPYEVNVIEYGNGVFGSALTDATLNNLVNQAGFESGWTRLNLAVTDDQDPLTSIPVTAVSGEVYAGLPVIGASFLRLDNGVAGIEIKRYGFAFDHAYTRAISAATAPN